jgi:hypothetical protein
MGPAVLWDPMADICEKCGRNLALVGRIHNCVVNTDPVVNTPIRDVVNKKRGYPNTEARRAYMKTYMAKRRAKT